MITPALLLTCPFSAQQQAGIPTKLGKHPRRGRAQRGVSWRPHPQHLRAYEFIVSPRSSACWLHGGMAGRSGSGRSSLRRERVVRRTVYGRIQATG